MPDAKKQGETRWTLAKLTQHDWDFASLPIGYEFQCWAYEYARESDYIVRYYKKAQVLQRDSGAGAFDEHGTYRGTIPWNEALDEIEELKLPSGFPEKPFLDTDYAKLPSRKQDSASGVTLDDPRWRQGFKAPPRGKFVSLWVDFDCSDQRLTRDFREVLKRFRATHQPTETRGKSEAKKCMAELKALAAYRLMEAAGTLPLAKKFLSQQGKPLLYRKDTNWYSAPEKVKAVLVKHFGM